MRTWHVGLLALVIAAGVSSSAYAQNAQITGTVKDQSGAIIPGATITSRNVDTGFARTAVSDGSGEYRLVSLPPGRYSVSTELSGFSTETRPDIVLIIDQTAIINFSLKPATLSETVTVTGESPIVDVTRSDVSTSVSSQQIQDLPVASRRWIDLAMLTPGTSQDNIRGFFYRGNVNVGAGTREYSNGFLVDGVNRVATVTAFRGDGQVNWVLKRWTQYVDVSNLVIWTTDRSALLGVTNGVPGTLIHPCAPTDLNYGSWGGMLQDYRTGETCAGWTSVLTTDWNSSLLNTFTGVGQTFPNNGGHSMCSNLEQVLCVEQ